jgi:hypothetical protein
MAMDARRGGSANRQPSGSLVPAERGFGEEKKSWFRSLFRKRSKSTAVVRGLSHGNKC